MHWRRAGGKHPELLVDASLIARASEALERGRAERHPMALQILFAFLKDVALVPWIRQAPVEVTNTAQDLARVAWLTNGFSGSRRDIDTWALHILRGPPEPTGADVAKRVEVSVLFFSFRICCIQAGG